MDAIVGVGAITGTYTGAARDGTSYALFAVVVTSGDVSPSRGLMPPKGSDSNGESSGNDERSENVVGAVLRKVGDAPKS